MRAGAHPAHECAVSTHIFFPLASESASIARITDLPAAVRHAGGPLHPNAIRFAFPLLTMLPTERN